ncbi:MAG TPA: HAMP domain-containing sensor histidine kinase [Micromonosporaceae bacterium]
MRSRLVLLVGATSSLVLIAFLVPLAVLVRSAAADRALAAATVQAQALAPAVATVDQAILNDMVSQANQSGDFPTTVFLPNGQVVGPGAARSVAVVSGLAGSSSTVPAAGGREVVVAVAGLRDGTAAIRTFVPDDRLTAGVGRAWAVLGLLGLGLLGLSLLVADLLARTLTRPLSAVGEVSYQLAQGDLGARAEDRGPPEVRQVSAGLNLLASRISELLAQERELVADLSHRLRTPLTALRIDVESVPDLPTRARLEADLDAVDRTVDAVIHEANRSAREGVAAACDATEVVLDRVRFWSALAEEEGRAVRLAVDPVRVPVRLDRGDLAACVDALIGNVFRHTSEGIGLSVTLTRRPEGGGRLVVSDDGPGLPDGLVQRRGVSGAGSTGLGLDIVTRTARRTGGEVRLGRSATGGAAVAVDLGPPPAGPVAGHRMGRRTSKRRPGT